MSTTDTNLLYSIALNRRNSHSCWSNSAGCLIKAARLETQIQWTELRGCASGLGCSCDCVNRDALGSATHLLLLQLHTIDNTEVGADGWVALEEYIPSTTAILHLAAY